MNRQYLPAFKSCAILLGPVLLACLALGSALALGSSPERRFESRLGGGADFTVNDPSDPGGITCTVVSCTLRAAITAANAGSVSGTQTIDFNLPYPITITLSSPLPAVTGTLVISGPGSLNLTVSGDSLYRGFEVGSGGSLALNDLTIAEGHDDMGGGIFVDEGNLALKGVTIRQGYAGIFGGGIFLDQGSLTLQDSLILENLAGGGDGGGLHNISGTVSISNTTFAYNHGFHDGGITNKGNMTVSDSLFLGNQGRVGGGIDNTGALTVTNSTFTQNVAPISSGGAILNGGSLIVANSTFFDNGSPQGADIYSGAGVVHVTNSTFYSATLPSLNSLVSAGVSSTLVLSNTILAAGPGIDNCASLLGGTFAVSLDNLSTDETCPGATPVITGTLLLGPLQDNGGSTPTLALLAGSAAIDAGADSACLAPVGPPAYGAGGLDQRGIARPQGAGCDAGAFERLPFDLFLPLVVQTTQ